MEEWKKLNFKIEESYMDLTTDGLEVKETTYIFAKNGVGKTQYTNKIPKDDNIFIFNDDFTSKNVFYSQKDKNEDDFSMIKGIEKSQEKNTFDLMFGHNVQETIEEINKKQLKLADIENQIKSAISDGFLVDIRENYSPTITKIKKGTNLTKIPEYVIKTNITDKYKILDESISTNIFINKYNAFSKLMEKYNDSVEALMKEVKNTSEVELAVINIHKAAQDYGKPFDFINYPVDQNELSKHIKGIETQKSSLTNEYNSCLENLKKEYDDLINDKFLKESDIDFLKVSINKIKSLKIDLIKKRDTLDMTDVHKIEFYDELKPIDKGSIQKEINDFVSENIYGLLKTNIKKMFEERSSCISEINALEKIKEENLEKFTIETLEILNGYIKHFEIDYFTVDFDTKPAKGKDGTTKLIIVGERQLKTLSEGEAKILSLSYFLTVLQTKINKLSGNLILVFDDPFDSNDHTRVNLIKNIPFNFGEEKIKSLGVLQTKYEMKNKGNKIKLLILTHNINVLYALTSNLIIKNEEEMFYNIKYEDSIEIMEWKKIENKIDISKVYTPSFFPNETYISLKLDSLNKKMINNNIHPSIARSIWFTQMRLNEAISTTKRNHYKALVKNLSWGTSTPENSYEPSKIESMYSALEKYVNDKKWFSENEAKIKEYLRSVKEENEKENNFQLVDENLLNLIPNIKKEEASVLCNTINRLINFLNSAMDDKNCEKIRRARHKEYLASTITAFGIEEW